MAYKDIIVENLKGGGGFKMPEYDVGLRNILVVNYISNTYHTEGIDPHNHYGDLPINNNVYLL